jgi:MoaA/NifB/PqqE/SkfB family radical SAM enzyme
LVKLVRRIRENLLARVRAMPLAQHAWARLRKRRYEAQVSRFVTDGSGRADRLPRGVVYEATMRCNLHCEFCYVGDLLNLEGEWRQELTIEALSRAFPEQKDFQISLTGGEIFMRKDIMSVLDLFREKGYAAGYLTTNGTIITEERAEALADLAAKGFLKHISVSVDGPKELHDAARGLKGTFERTTEGLRRLQAAAKRKGAPLRVSINTTVAHESLEALDQMVDVAEQLGVDAIGLNHLMFSTPEEVAETVRMIGATDASVIATFVTPDPGLDAAQVRRKVAALAQKCKDRNILFDFRPKVHTQLMDSYYSPGTKLEGRCLYPFLHARVSFSGKVFFCPFIRVEVGDLTESTLEQVWNGERYVDMRRRLLEHGIFPVCRRCCKVELSPVPAVAAADIPRRRAIPVTVVHT